MKTRFIILILLIISSCTSKVEKSISFKNMDKSFKDSLYPTELMKERGYITFNVEISGFSNDSIILNLYDGEKESNIYLKDSFSERYMEEYLGKLPRYIYLDPYKSTNNTIEIKYGLYK